MNPPIQDWVHVTGWTLIHFVWQGALLAAATAAALQLCRRRSSEARYAIACIGLMTMLAAPLATAIVVGTPDLVLTPIDDAMPAVAGPRAPIDARPAPGAGVSPLTKGAAATSVALDAWLPVVVWSWLVGVAVLLTRFAGGCWRVHRLRVASLAEEASSWQSAGERLAARLGLDVAFRIVESRLVDAPGVIGSLRPVILLPVAVLANLTPGQIESILAHELAHIRRRDYAVNLLQTVSEALLFFHPAVWWVSSRIRQEREHCCDDVAVDLCGEASTYAAALAELASWRTRDLALSVGAADGPLLARVRRLLRPAEEHEPRSVTGLATLALGIMLTAGVAVQSTSQGSASQSLAADQPEPVKTRQAAGTWLTRHTDHFEIHYTPNLDLHAERAGREAERAYAQVSADLRHELAFKVPLLLFNTTNALQQHIAGAMSGQPHAASFADPSGDRILLAMDQPVDQWFGIITHEVAHVFAFDIVPGTATSLWIAEGLAEYERGQWDPNDLVTLRDAVRTNAVPRLSSIDGPSRHRASRVPHIYGHAAFDFIESRWGKAGVRQFIFWLRRTARNGGDPFAGALELSRDQFNDAFETYLDERFAAVQPPARFDYGATAQIEGEITAISTSVPVGLACIELWVATEGRARQRWAIECNGAGQEVLKALKPGDRVTVTGAPARDPSAQRLAMQSLARASDGFTWREQSR